MEAFLSIERIPTLDAAIRSYMLEPKHSVPFTYSLNGAEYHGRLASISGDEDIHAITLFAKTKIEEDVDPETGLMPHWAVSLVWFRDFTSYQLRVDHEGVAVLKPYKLADIELVSQLLVRGKNNWWAAQEIIKGYGRHKGWERISVYPDENLALFNPYFDPLS